MPLERDGEMPCTRCGKWLTMDDAYCYSCGGTVVAGPRFAELNPACSSCGQRRTHAIDCPATTETYRFDVTNIETLDPKLLELEMRFHLPKSRFDPRTVQRLIHHIADFRP